jgi:hypothetical protein
MPVRTGNEPTTLIGGKITPAITDSLAQYQVDYWPPHTGDVAPVGGSPAYRLMPPSEWSARARIGSRPLAFFDDFYYRIHITPVELALGNVVSEQTRQVNVWNAYPDRSVTLTAIGIDPLAGITIDGPPAPPLTFPALAERTYDVHVALVGSSSIDTLVLWTFTGIPAPALHITGNRTLAFPWRPDWSKGVLETLEWRTDIIAAQEDTEQRIAMRNTPRQTWEFTVANDGTARQTMTNALIGMQAFRWAIPQWPHGADLVDNAPAGSTTIKIPTYGRGFFVGGIFLLIDQETGAHEAGEVDSITADAIEAKLPLASTWRKGVTTLYPAKPSTVDDAGTLEHFTGAADEARVRFMTDEPVDHDATVTMPVYRGVPVLEDIPDWTTAPTLKPERMMITIDNKTSLPQRFDKTGVAMLTQGQNWTPVGRAQIERIRSLQYLLKGARGALWIPSWMQDMTLASDTLAATFTLPIVNCGYASFLKGKLHRRDIRIESDQGVLYRRITDAVEGAGNTEGLTLDASIPYPLSAAPGAVTISFLAVFRQASDRQEWAWWCGDKGGDFATADVPMPMRTFTNDI